ncbi:hypothetical protein C0416_01560 [bacterium]|nr:hypothetical protein [bacterium]
MGILFLFSLYFTTKLGRFQFGRRQGAAVDVAGLESRGVLGRGTEHSYQKRCLFAIHFDTLPQGYFNAIL